MELTGTRLEKWISKWGAPVWRVCNCGNSFACGSREARENCYDCEATLRRIFGENDPAGRDAK